MARELGGGVYITNLEQFRRDLKYAVGASPREMTAAIKRAGGVFLQTTKSYAGMASRTGTHAAGFKLQVRGATGALINLVPYAAGAEWGIHGHWSGFMRYGAPGRFAYKAVQDKADEFAAIVAEELRDVAELHGWAR